MDRNQHDLEDRAERGLPLRGIETQPRRAILAAHLIFTGHAHWLPNDLRGSGSTSVRKEELESIGPVLPGRQSPQPARDHVKQFFQTAEEKLDHDRIWFNTGNRVAIANAFEAIASQHGYTLWACSIYSNQAHIVVRTHRDRAAVIWSNLMVASRLALRGAHNIPKNHPIWSHRAYKVFLYSSEHVRRCIKYVNDNPGKERLPRQNWSFVQHY